MVTIRTERREDVAAVRAVNEAAFPEAVEADIVERLRTACSEAVSLVAEDGNQIIGHICFSPVEIVGRVRSVSGMGLGPMAVVPARQRQGIGSALVETGLQLMRERDCPFVVVLGHSDYYPRFGFRRASLRGLSCQWAGVPDDAFMVAILDESAMAGVSGTVKYRKEFDSREE